MMREGDVRIPAGCAIVGIFSKNGEKMDGGNIVKSIAVMHDRSNGLGGGFAAYGIYPEHKDFYAFHMFFDDDASKEACEALLKSHFVIADCSEIPVKNIPAITDKPLIWRYFVAPIPSQMEEQRLEEREYVFRFVMRVNSQIEGAYIFSSGKNMGVFKAVGFPEDVGEFYRLSEYEGYCFTAHGRYPTNTPGWWGGAHPFALLDYTVVHNGEISSYDTNRRSMQMYGYKCTLQTDTEVITYIVDYLHRRVGLTLKEIASVMAAPFWQSIEKMPEAEKQKLTYLRNAFSSQLITGPFSILVGFEGGIMALNDRLKLRSMVAAERGNKVYFSSEESAIRVIEPSFDWVRALKGGEAVIVTLNGGNQ